MDNNTPYKIDVYRGFLCQYVILAHFIPRVFPGASGIPGTLAVWCFFVISGFLNYKSYNQSSSAKNYYLKRLRRLMPLLICSFVIVATLEGTLFVNDFYTLIPAIININHSMPRNNVLWTIVIELQLYILTPLFCAIFKKTVLKNNNLIYLIFVTALSSLLVGALSSKLIVGIVDLCERMVFSAIPLYVFGFFLAKKDISYSSHTLQWFFILSWLLFLVVVLSRNGLTCIFFNNFIDFFIMGKFIPLMLTSFVVLDPIVRKTNRCFVLLGRATYEIYLFHGLFAYLLSSYFASTSNVFLIVLFYWVFPIAIGLLVFYFYPVCKREIFKFIPLFLGKELNRK